MAGLSAVLVVSRPGRAWCVLLVRWCRGRQWLALPGLCGGPYGPGWPCLAAVAVPYVMCSPLGVLFSWFAQFQDVRACGRCVVASTLVGTPSSLPNVRLVLPSDVLGRGSRVGSVPVVPVALGRYGTFCRCIAPS